jgi:hypothetical protein
VDPPALRFPVNFMSKGTAGTDCLTSIHALMSTPFFMSPLPPDSPPASMAGLTRSVMTLAQTSRERPAKLQALFTALKQPTPSPIREPSLTPAHFYSNTLSTLRILTSHDPSVQIIQLPELRQRPSTLVSVFNGVQTQLRQPLPATVILAVARPAGRTVCPFTFDLAWSPFGSSTFTLKAFVCRKSQVCFARRDDDWWKFNRGEKPTINTPRLTENYGSVNFLFYTLDA